MKSKFKQPDVERYLHWLRRDDFFGMNTPCYDQKSHELLNQLFELIKKIKPIAENGCRALWFRADRGTIEDYGDVNELIEEGQFENEEEFIQEWKWMFPDEVKWYLFEAVELEDEPYRAVALGNKMIIVEDERREHNGFPNEIPEFVEWLIDSTKECIEMLENGTYNDFVKENLPPQHRTGTILRKHYWQVRPECKESFFEDISEEDVNEFCSLVAESNLKDRKPIGRLKTMTANDFFRFCAMGYAENKYDGCNKTPKEQYYLHADGRDDELSEIDADSPEAFEDWLDNRHRGGHPWEVCRGGNSTHISLYVFKDNDGYYLRLAGDAWNRTIETVKFYLALHRNNVPVVLEEATTLANRLRGTEKMGIVPHGVTPAYCESRFPNEHIIDFMNLPFEDMEKFLPFCVWQEIEETELKDER